MGWEDYCFEDPWESYDRGREDPSPCINQKTETYRICTKCDYEFSSVYPSSCPDCGGWTKEKGEIDE